MPHLVLFWAALHDRRKVEVQSYFKKESCQHTVENNNWRAFETNFRNTEMDFAFSNKSILKPVKMKDSGWALILSFWSWVGSVISEFFSQTLQRSLQHFFQCSSWVVGRIVDVYQGVKVLWNLPFGSSSFKISLNIFFSLKMELLKWRL